ncbi:MAG: hypothetical protein ACT4NU_10450 [Chromatiales bacterium]
MNNALQPSARSRRLTLIGIIAAFTLPILIAWLLSSGMLEWLPRGRLNYGTLIEPPVDLSRQTFVDEGNAVVAFKHRLGDWTLATIVEMPCGNDCRDTLDRMRRVHLALREEMGQVHLAAIVDRGTPVADLRSVGADTNTQVYRTVAADLMELLRRALAAEDPASGYNRLMLIDYAGRAMLIYPPRADMGGVHKDLKRLLRASKTAG